MSAQPSRSAHDESHLELLYGLGTGHVVAELADGLSAVRGGLVHGREGLPGSGEDVSAAGRVLEREAGGGGEALILGKRRGGLRSECHSGLQAAAESGKVRAQRRAVELVASEPADASAVVDAQVQGAGAHGRDDQVLGVRACKPKGGEHVEERLEGDGGVSAAELRHLAHHCLLADAAAVRAKREVAATHHVRAAHGSRSSSCRRRESPRDSGVARGGCGCGGGARAHHGVHCRGHLGGEVKRSKALLEYPE